MSESEDRNGKVKVRVRVHRKKVDENGVEILHQHRHRQTASRILKHKDGIIAAESVVSDSTSAFSVQPLSTNDLETDPYFEKETRKKKPEKQMHQRYTLPRTKVNSIKEKKAFESDDEDNNNDFTNLEQDFTPKERGINSKFRGRGFYDTATSTMSTLESAIPVTATETIEQTVEQKTGAPRTSQSFTSFVGEEKAKDMTQTQTHSLNDDDIDDDSSAQRRIIDPFQITQEEPLEILYPSTRRQPTHSFDSADLKDPYEWIMQRRITSIESVDKDEMEVEEYDGSNKNEPQLKIFQNAQVSKNAFQRSKHKHDFDSTKQSSEIESESLQFNPDPEHEDPRKYKAKDLKGPLVQASDQGMSSQIVEEIEEEIEIYPSNTDGNNLTTVTELVSATTGSAEYVEGTSGNAFIVVSGSGATPKRARPRRGITENGSLRSITPNSGSSPYKANKGNTLTTVTELVTATPGSAEFQDASRSGQGQMYVEVTATQTAGVASTNSTDTDQNNLSSSAVEMQDDEEEYEEEYDEEETVSD